MIKIDWRSCDSMAEIPEQEQMEYWVDWLASYHDRDLCILEVGSFHGQSTALLAQFGKVTTIDLWSNVDDCLADYEGIGIRHWEAFIQNMTRLKLVPERVIPVVSTSDAVSNMGFFDVIFIDANHNYEAVKKDVLNTHQHLLHGGLLIFDDYKRPGFGYPPLDGEFQQQMTDPWIGVQRAVDELLELGGYKIVEHFRGKICLRKGYVDDEK